QATEARLSPSDQAQHDHAFLRSPFRPDPSWRARCTSLRHGSQLASDCLGEQLSADLVQVTAIVIVHVQAIIEYPGRIEEIYPRRKAVSARFDEKGIDDFYFCPRRRRLRTGRFEIVAFSEPLVGVQNVEIGSPDAL